LRIAPTVPSSATPRRLTQAQSRTRATSPGEYTIPEQSEVAVRIGPVVDTGQVPLPALLNHCSQPLSRRRGLGVDVLPVLCYHLAHTDTLLSKVASQCIVFHLDAVFEQWQLVLWLAHKGK